MQLDLTDDEAQLLREVLTDTLRDLSPEIADTDNASYRRVLRERRTELQGIVDRLGSAAQGT